MIKDNIRNAFKYYGLGERFETALRFLESYTGAADARADIPVADGVFVKCRPYITKPEDECSFETHNEHADIHLVVSGVECIGYAPADGLSVKDVDLKEDMIRLGGKGVNIPMLPGDFMITFPEDAHMPCVSLNKPEFCGKLIAKVKL